MNAKSSLKFAAVGAAIALAASSLLASAPAAQAYPAGQDLTVTSSKYNVLTPGTSVRVQTTNVYPGCSVYTAFRTTNGAKRIVTAGEDGSTAVISLATPSKPGIYQLMSKTTKDCVSPEGAEVDIVYVYVGKQTNSISRVSASSSSASKNPVLTVTGSVRYGTTGVAYAPVVVQIHRPDGTHTEVFTTTAAADGRFTIRVAGHATQKGVYTASVVFAGVGSFLKSSATSHELVLTK